MITNNEKEFFSRIANHLHYVAEAQQYIKENYGVESAYDEDTNTLYIVSSDRVNESFNMASAKDYLDNGIGLEMLNVEYAK